MREIGVRELKAMLSETLRAVALRLPRDELVLATWDRRLHAAARAEALEVVPEALGV